MTTYSNKEALTQNPELVEAVLNKRSTDIYYTIGELETYLDGGLSRLVKECIVENNGADFVSLFGSLSGCWVHVRDDNLNNRVYMFIAPRRTTYTY